MAYKVYVLTQCQYGIIRLCLVHFTCLPNCDREVMLMLYLLINALYNMILLVIIEMVSIIKMCESTF